METKIYQYHRGHEDIQDQLTGMRKDTKQTIASRDTSVWPLGAIHPYNCELFKFSTHQGGAYCIYYFDLATCRNACEYARNSYTRCQLEAKQRLENGAVPGDVKHCDRNGLQPTRFHHGSLVIPLPRLESPNRLLWEYMKDRVFTHRLKTFEELKTATSLAKLAIA